MKIAKLTGADIKQQAQVHAAAFCRAYRGILPDSFLAHFTVEKREAFFSKEFEKYKDTYTIKDGEKLAGFSTIGSCRDDEFTPGQKVGEVWGIYIHPDYQGKGYGSKLFGYVVTELKKRGYQTVKLWVLDANRQARAFYEKKGFFPDGADKELDFKEEGKVLEVRYSKNI